MDINRYGIKINEIHQEDLSTRIQETTILDRQIKNCIRSAGTEKDKATKVMTFSPTVLVNRRISRKRKKGEIANPENTLDGLVAKRIKNGTDGAESLMKRYLSEKEAIEAPTEYQEILRIEADPDVSTRTCSVCGYQGKWVSEMIRHKRVHTNDRPFKCRYCSRTSKWKADLIRHVAKTHGIRVVSKYSRSKTFDTSSSSYAENKRDVTIDLQNGWKSDADQKMRPYANHLQNNTPKPCYQNIQYKCLICLTVQESLISIVTHLRSDHNEPPYKCLACGRKFTDVHCAEAHCNTASLQSNQSLNQQLKKEGSIQIPSVESDAKPLCSLSVLKINVAPIFPGEDPLSTSESQMLVNCLFKLLSTNAIMSGGFDQNAAGIFLKKSDDHQTSPHIPLNIESMVTSVTNKSNRITFCNICPFKSDLSEMILHKRGHNAPTGCLSYKCAFCKWYAKKKAAIERHMLVHTSDPKKYMELVGRNLITPVVLSHNQCIATAMVSREKIIENKGTNSFLIAEKAAIPEQVSSESESKSSVQLTRSLSPLSTTYPTAAFQLSKIFPHLPLETNPKSAFKSVVSSSVSAIATIDDLTARFSVNSPTNTHPFVKISPCIFADRSCNQLQSLYSTIRIDAGGIRNSDTSISNSPDS